MTLAATSDGIYNGTITITKDSQKEFEVYYDTSYGTKVGPVDQDGNISIGSDVWKFWVDDDPISGTYNLTINLVNNTWSISKAE